jgi:hypothetical protein
MFLGSVAWGLVMMMADARRVPRPHAMVAVAFCIADVAANGPLEFSHDWPVRGVQMGTAAVVCAVAYYLAFRRTFLLSLAGPVPRRGLYGWLARLPGWQMIMALLACCWLVPLAITAAAWSLVHLSGESATLLGMGIVLLLMDWALAAAVLEQRRQARLAGACK